MTGDVWYAAYGSNLSRSRFEFYIKGGTPPGATRPYPGCRDRKLPSADRAWTIPGRLVFGKHSETWNGGVAFLELDAAEHARGRLYRVTTQQLDDIVAQENRLSPGQIRLHEQQVGQVFDLGQGFYPSVVCLAELDGRRVVTITDELDEYTKPSSEYLTHVVDGLRESHGMTPDEIAAYLVPLPGIAGEMTSDELVALSRRS